jgi:hypothetical protein
MFRFFRRLRWFFDLVWMPHLAGEGYGRISPALAWRVACIEN